MSNTGKKIVLTLKKIQNPGTIDTGLRKDNLPADTDYIAPYNDLSACPLTYANTCPVVKYTSDADAGTLEYEFSLANAVVNNPAVVKIVVQETTSLNEQEYVLPNTPSPNYFRGSFTGLVGVQGLEITYYNTLDVLVQTCTIF